MLVVHPSLPVYSVRDLIDYAKANPSKLNFGSSGAGRADHLAGELFKTLTGVKMQHVPYKGGAKTIVTKLHREINRTLELPDAKARLEVLGIFPFLLPTPDAFGDYIKSEIKKYAQVVKDSGARAE
jgi:tripartite-type tricarboxylate transporter receptor subunit TctC